MEGLLVIIYNKKNFPQFGRIEVVERKGIGHPDTLANQIAESACCAISKFFIKRYKILPRFNIDQVEIVGGDVEVDFLKGKIIKSGIISISGKTSYLKHKDITVVNKIVAIDTRKTIEKIFSKDILKFFAVKTNIGGYSEKNKIFFENKTMPLSEDTCLGIGFYPYTDTEKLTLDISTQLNKLSKVFPIGKDTKVMVVRKNKNIQIIISAAFLSNKIKDLNEYFLIKGKIKSRLLNFIKNKIKNKFELIINNADNKKEGRAYITLSGTAAEHDKGSLARGNGISGLIVPYRPASLEVIYGKNPVYNISKLYNLFARYLAKKIAFLFNNDNIFITVEILSVIGNEINRPGAILVNTSRRISEVKTRNLIKKEFDRLFKMVSGANYTVLTKEILKGNNRFYEY
jgi:S-adenosylmethionine synthetase